ncbi:metallophosphoesterase family protein [Candidatus Uabimicrobium amorphum]|uniref:Phosphoesterase n=1 Tax=Uabimicrobium amorphum TaxID=2596890 RepID=A0A5S9IN25_UABAM|nr:metallophosphoesterase family protein [Candidatus Uabimicrobium amorphum]BBM84923.1 phosphoesterase [Candidatus Uabimicrobium amorphum]
MVRVAIISDIHANLEACEAVLADIDRHGIDDIISLGDNVGYGPNPVEVLLRLHERDIMTLEGNHDLAVINPKSFANASGYAASALEWTRERLSNHVSEDMGFQEILGIYFGAPAYSVLHDNHNVLLVHGSPGKHKVRFNYLLAPEDFLAPKKYMKKMRCNICFFGHTHRQIMWEVDNEGVSLIEYEVDEALEYSDAELKNLYLFLNPGSVGQPRDNNPDAAYLIYEKIDDRNIITFKRVAYDVNTTIEKIYQEDLLSNMLGDRLIRGA